MAGQLKTLEGSRLWDAMDEGHKAMLRFIGEYADAPESRLDPAGWAQWLDDFQVVAEHAWNTDPMDTAPMIEMIERGYRRILFVSSNEIHELGSDPTVPLIGFGDLVDPPG